MKKLANIGFVYKYLIKVTPFYFAHMILFAIYNAAELFMEFIYGPKYLIDLIQYGGTLQQGLRYVSLVALLILVKVVWAAAATHYWEAAAKEKIVQKMQEQFYQKAFSCDLKYYDDTEFYNDMLWSLNNCKKIVEEILKDSYNMLTNILQVICLVSFFLYLDVLGILVCLLSVGIGLYFSVKASKMTYAMNIDMNFCMRKRDYFNRVFYLKEFAQEVRFYSVAEVLKNKFRKSNEGVRQIADKYGRKVALYTFLGDFLANEVIVKIFYLAYLVYNTMMNGLFSYGSFISLFSSASNLNSSLQTIVKLYSNFVKHSLSLEKMLKFIGRADVMPSGKYQLPSKEDFETLALKEVSFSYGGGKNALDNISLDIRKGQKIALVGYNGAGKTTLIKLLMRLYDVDSGEILLNGRNIKEYDLGKYRKYFGCIFQDYKLYAATLEENVRMGENGGSGDQVAEALIKSGFIEKKEDYGSYAGKTLTREFDDNGLVPSGGQQQKIAIARIFVGNFPILILDEPSSALDPISEYNLNNTLMEIAREETVIFISHRLSTTQMADKIYMLEKGKIIEEGSHEQLLAQNGQYAEIYHMQANRYKNQ